MDEAQFRLYLRALRVALRLALQHREDVANEFHDDPNIVKLCTSWVADLEATVTAVNDGLIYLASYRATREGYAV